MEMRGDCRLNRNGNSTTTKMRLGKQGSPFAPFVSELLLKRDVRDTVKSRIDIAFS